MDIDQARVVVIGGGITGCSVAYHLALAGRTDLPAGTRSTDTRRPFHAVMAAMTCSIERATAGG